MNLAQAHGHPILETPYQASSDPDNNDDDDNHDDEKDFPFFQVKVSYKQSENSS